MMFCFMKHFYKKLSKLVKSSTYITIIEIFKIMRPLTSISCFVNIPIFNKRFDIISCLLKNIDIYEGDIWTNLYFCEIFFMKATRNDNKIILRLLSKFSTSIEINERKRRCLIHGIIKNNQIKYIHHILDQYEAGAEEIYFIIDAITDATILYQSIYIC